MHGNNLLIGLINQSSVRGRDYLILYIRHAMGENQAMHAQLRARCCVDIECTDLRLTHFLGQDDRFGSDEPEGVAFESDKRLGILPVYAALLADRTN